jgi:hypothetical protein
VLTLEPPQFNIRGLTIFRDFTDTRQFYYLPSNRARVSQNGKGLEFVVYTEDITQIPDFTVSEERAGGFLTLEVELGPSPEELEQVKSELASQSGVGNVNLSQVPFTNGTVKLFILGQSGSGASGAPKGLEVSIVGSTNAALFGRQTSVFSVRLGGIAANTLFETLRKSADPQAVVMYDLEFLAVRPSYNLEVEIDFKETFSYLRHKIGVNLLVASADIDLLTQEMINQGHITIREIDFSGKGNANSPIAGEGGVLKLVRDLMSPTLFSPTPTATPEFRALPDSATKALETGGGTKAILSSGQTAGKTPKPITVGTDLKITHTPVAAGQTPGGAVDISAIVQPAANVTVNEVKVSWRTQGTTAFQDVVLQKGAAAPAGTTPPGTTTTPPGTTPPGTTTTPPGTTPPGTTTTPPGTTSTPPVTTPPVTTPPGTTTTPGSSTTPAGSSTTPAGSATTPGGTATTPAGTATTPTGTATTPTGSATGATPTTTGTATGTGTATSTDTSTTPPDTTTSGGDTFSGKIPGQTAGTIIEYFIRAAGTKAGAAIPQIAPENGEKAPLSFSVGAASTQSTSTKLKLPETDGPLIGYSLQSIDVTQQVKRTFKLNRAEAVTQPYHPAGALSGDQIGPEFDAAKQITHVALGQGPFKVIIIKVQAGFEFEKHHVLAATVQIQYGKNSSGSGPLHALTVTLTKDQPRGQVQFFADDQGTLEYSYFVEFTYDPDRVVGTVPGQILRSQTFTGVTSRSITVDLDLHSPLIPVHVEPGVLSFENSLVKQVQVRVAPSPTTEGRVVQLAKDRPGDFVLVLPVDPANRSYHLQQKFFFQDGSTTVEKTGVVDSTVIVNEPNDLIFKMIPQFADNSNLVKEVLVDAVYTHSDNEQERSTLHLTPQAPRSEFAVLLRPNDPAEWAAGFRFVMNSGDPLEATSQPVRLAEPLVTLTKAGFKTITVGLLDENAFASDPDLLGVKVTLGQAVDDSEKPTASLLLRANRLSGTVVVPGVLPSGPVSVAVEVLRRNQTAQRTTSTLRPAEKELFVTT